MKDELISVIITTYKRSDKLEDAIKSVINQTYKNLEIIIVDDNSELKEERELTAKIVSKYKNIRYIKNEKNLGGSLSRNVGIKASKGNIICFLDDDDEYLPTRIEKMYECYKSHKNDNVGLIYCNCFSVDLNKNILVSYKNNVEGLPLYEQMLNCIASTSLWLVSKKALLDIGMFEDAVCKQDSIVLLKLIVNNYKIFSVHEELVLYYEHGGTGISGTKLKNIKGLVNYREWCRKYYQKLDSKEKVKNVEWNFSKQLISLYIINNMKKEAYSEFKNMLKQRPFKIKTYISFTKILFSNLYFKYLRRLNENKKRIS